MEIKSPRRCVRVCFHLQIYDISSNSWSECQWKTWWVSRSDTDALLWRVARLREQNDLHHKNTLFWVDLLLSWVNLFLPWAIYLCLEWIAFAVSEFLSREWFAFAVTVNAFQERTCKHDSKRRPCKISERRFNNLLFRKTYKPKECQM